MPQLQKTSIQIYPTHFCISFVFLLFTFKSFKFLMITVEKFHVHNAQSHDRNTDICFESTWWPLLNSHTCQGWINSAMLYEMCLVMYYTPFYFVILLCLQLAPFPMIFELCFGNPLILLPCRKLSDCVFFSVWLTNGKEESRCFFCLCWLGLSSLFLWHLWSPNLQHVLLTMKQLWFWWIHT